MNRLLALIGATLVAVGCADRGIVDVATQQAGQPEASLSTVPGNPGLTVMTWNVYYGTDPKIVLQAPSVDQIPVYAAQAWALVVQTNFPERAEALARAIAANRPELVGVQEAALWRTQQPSDFFTNPAPNAADVEYDFLALLTAALERRGQHYVVAAVDVTTDIEVPMLVGLDESNNPVFEDIRLTDRDAVLVRRGVHYSDAQSGVYSAAIPITLDADLPQIFIREGWSSVVAKVGGQNYRFVSTHLEAQDPDLGGDFVQYAQAQELVGTVLSDETLPTIVVGDFNSDANNPDPAKTRSYDLMTGTGDQEGGFTDSWLRPSSTPPGLTCCQSDDLTNASSTFDQRVDFIFTRNIRTEGHAVSLVLGRNVVGDELSDRTASGLWPSDHGGVVASFLVPPAGPRTSVVAE